MSKRKNHHKSKEQIILDEEQKKHREIMGAFIDNKFMPVMEEISKNIEDAQMMADALKIRIAQLYQNYSKTMKLTELKMEEQLRDKSPDYDRFKRIIDVLNEKTVDESLTILQGLVDETNRVAWLQIREKKLQDFKSNE